MGIHFPKVWELYGFLFLAKYVRNTWPWNVLSSHTFSLLSEITFPMFCGKYYWREDQQKNFICDPIFTQTFMWNSSIRNLTYFVAGPNPRSAFQIPLLLLMSAQIHFQRFAYFHVLDQKVAVAFDWESSTRERSKCQCRFL